MVPAPRFVVQLHARPAARSRTSPAGAVHFDLRLEVEGVLASWAVPKGPSYDAAVKRLAVRTPDHALEHADVEGRLEGGGAVIVWDAGHFQDVTLVEGRRTDLPAALERGHLRVRFDGEKLEGAWDLVRTAFDGDERNWLLVKVRDETADPTRDPVRDEPGSVRTGRTLEELRTASN